MLCWRHFEHKPHLRKLEIWMANTCKDDLNTSVRTQTGKATLQRRETGKQMTHNHIACHVGGKGVLLNQRAQRGLTSAPTLNTPTPCHVTLQLSSCSSLVAMVKKQLSPEKKAFALAWLQGGMAKHVVAKKLEVSLSTVKRLHRKAKNLPPLTIPKRKEDLGRPRKLSLTQMARMKRLVQKSPTLTARKIKHRFVILILIFFSLKMFFVSVRPPLITCRSAQSGTGSRTTATCPRPSR